MEPKQKTKQKRDVIVILLLCFFMIMVFVGVYLIFFSKEAKEVNEGYQRQEEEQDIADVYIKYLIALEEQKEKAAATASAKPSDGTAESGAKDETEAETEPEVTISMEDFLALIDSDKNYFERDGITFTPEYAKGSLYFVLDIPTAGIKRGVYTGTWDDINYNLDIWMVTVARPDYILGETHMCIYGHNHTAQNLSFNNLKDVKKGDEFYFYAESGYYRYEVTDIFAAQRSDIATKYCDNFELGSDLCYIMTCGRDYILIDGQSTRYKDFVVEGTLVEHLTLKEYVKIVSEEAEKESK